jgi:ATP-dependent helicase/nuclease subunit B
MILLVPEQASLQSERLLINGVDGFATHRACVLSFKRLAYRVLATSGAGARTALTPAARAMMLRLLMLRRSGELRYYRNSRTQAGFIERLGACIAELIEQGVDPDAFLNGDEPNDDPVRSAKLHDLRLLYASYLHALGPDRMDPTQHLEAARLTLDCCDWLDGASVWVDGFAGFSRQEALMLAALASKAVRVEVTALIDPDRVAEARPPGERSCELFARTGRMIRDLTDLLHEREIFIEPALKLVEAPKRFERSPDLARLESSFFGVARDEPMTPGAVRIAEAADRRTEVSFAVSQVLSLVQRTNGPLRYRDIAIVVRDLQPYYALLSAALQLHDIPVFIDRRRPTAHHPLVELIRGLVAVAAEDYAPRPVRALLKTGLLSLTDDLADALENHILATGMSGRDCWVGDPWKAPARSRDMSEELAEVYDRRRNVARLGFVRDVDDWVQLARNSLATGAEWSAGLRTVLQHLDVDKRIEGWAREADDEGDLDQGEAHRQILRDVDALLADLETTLADQPFGVAELGMILDAALAQFTIGLTPPMLDQVLVGSIERSRHPEIKTLILLGLNEGLFPAVPAEDSILNDDDRRWLEQRGVRLGVPRAQRVFDEALLLYVACTRPSESLVVTYAAADENGRSLQPSPYLTALRAACPGIEIERVPDPFLARSDWSVGTARSIAAQLAYEIRNRPEQSLDNQELRGRWNDLYESARTDAELRSTLGSALQSLVYDNKASLSPDSMKAVASDPCYASVSQLETFAACPFKHFSQYRLRLQERELSELAMLDIGTIHHAILEHFIKKLVHHQRSLADLDDETMHEALQDAFSEAVPLMSGLSNARDHYVLARSRQELSRVLEGQRRAAKSGAFRPRATELKFGVDAPDSLPALKIETPKGRQLLLRGFIDRVDVAEVADELLGVVVDYKRTRNKRLDLSSVYHGLSLQLIGYLLVLAQRGKTLTGRPIKPAGAFYVGLIETYRRVRHPNEAAKENIRTQAHRFRGVMDVGHIAAFDAESSPGGWLENYSVYRKRDGTLGNLDRSDAAETDSFQALLKHTRERIGQVADRMLDGEIAVSPYRLGNFSPCSWCAFPGVCRVEPGVTQLRFMETLKRSEILQRLSGGSASFDE